MDKRKKWSKLVLQEKKSLVNTYLNLVYTHQSLANIDDYREIEEYAEHIIYAMDIAYENRLWNELCQLGLIFCDVSNGYLGLRSRFDEQEKYLEKSIEAARKAKRRFDEISLRGNLIVLRESNGKQLDSEKEYKQMLRFYRRNHSEINAARVIHMLARKARVDGKLTYAKKLYLEALEVYKKEEAWDNITISLNQLGELARIEEDYETAGIYFEESRRLCVEHNLLHNESIALEYLANLAYDRGDKETLIRGKKIHYRKAINIYTKVYRIQVELNNDSGKADALLFLGNLLRLMRKYNIAIKLIKHSLEVFGNLNRLKDMSEGLYFMALAYQEKGESQNDELDRLRSFDEAERIYLQCLAVQENLLDENLSARTISQLGFLYTNIGDVDQSRNMHKQSLDMRKHCNDKEGMLTDHFQLAILEHELAGHSNSVDDSKLYYKKAEFHYKECLRLSEELNDVEEMKITASQLGNLYLATKNYDLSRMMFENSISIKNKIHDYEGIINDKLSLGHLYQELGILQTNQANKDYYFKESEENAIYCLNAASQHNQKIYEAKANMLLGILYQQYGKSEDLILSYYEKAIPVLYEYGELDNIAVCKINMSEIYEMRENPAKAKTLIEEVFPIVYRDMPIYLQELIETLNRLQKKLL